MRTLLVINDNSTAARHAAEFAFIIAQKVEADILLLNTSAVATKQVKKVTAGDIENESEDYRASGMLRYLRSFNGGRDCFKPGIAEFGNGDITETEVSDFVNKNNIWMMVKSMPQSAPTRIIKNLNFPTVLN